MISCHSSGRKLTKSEKKAAKKKRPKKGGKHREAATAGSGQSHRSHALPGVVGTDGVLLSAVY